MSTFLIGTIICFVAQDFGMLLTGRLVQAAGVGVSMPLLQTIMLSIFPPEKRGAAMGTTGIVIGLAPALGPTLSGWIIDSYTWRDLFGMVIPIVVLVLILASFLMKMSFNYLIQVSMSYRSFFLLSALVAYFTVSQALVIKVGVARKSMDS